MDLNEIERNLKDEETYIIQQKIRKNLFVDEVRVVAERILIERNEEIPLAETDEEAEAKFSHNSKMELIILLLFVIYGVVLYVGHVTTIRFIFFTAALFFSVRYTFNRRVK